MMNQTNSVTLKIDGATLAKLSQLQAEASVHCGKSPAHCSKVDYTSTHCKKIDYRSN